MQMLPWTSSTTHNSEDGPIETYESVLSKRRRIDPVSSTSKNYDYVSEDSRSSDVLPNVPEHSFDSASTLKL